VLELLSLEAVQRCAIGLLIGAVSLPVVGVFIVGLDIIAVRFAVMHVALLGIAVGMLTGLDPVLCGLVACALAGAGVAPLAVKGGRDPRRSPREGQTARCGWSVPRPSRELLCQGMITMRFSGGTAIPAGFAAANAATRASMS
jgi:hypothetical protein